MVEICPRCGLREVEPTAQEGFCAECIIERIRESYGDKQRSATLIRREAWSDRSQQSWQRERQRVHRLKELVRPREPASALDPWEIAHGAINDLSRIRKVRMRAEHYERLDAIEEGDPPSRLGATGRHRGTEARDLRGAPRPDGGRVAASAGAAESGDSLGDSRPVLTGPASS